MADLRDQLLRAGLIDKKTKQQADTSDRRKRKRKKKKKKTNAEPTAEQRRQAEYDARIAAEAEENRQRAQARQHQQQAKELELRIAGLAGSGAVRETRPGQKRFFFVSRERKIVWLYPGKELVKKLEIGLLAIVEHPGDADEPYAIVPRETAERIQALDPEAVRFWNRDGAPPEDGSTE